MQTVRGLISPLELGKTMMHEHMFFNGSFYFAEPEDPAFHAYAQQPVSLDNLWWVKYNAFSNRDSLVFIDVDQAIAETELLVVAGGGTLVDASPRWAGTLPPPSALARISQVTGLHIVKGCGYDVDGSYPPEANVPGKTIDELTEDMLEDIRVGIGGSDVRAGIIGEIGCSWPMTQTEIKVLRAAAQTQRETGLSITVHPGRNDKALGQIRDILASERADLSRVILGHIDRCGYTLDTRRDVLDSGCVLEYDFFGWEGHYPPAAAIKDGAYPDMPSDASRVREIRDLIEKGYDNQIVVSQDISTKIQRARYGGCGFGHILRNVVPLMAVYGIPTAGIEQILTGTPQRLLASI